MRQNRFRFLAWSARSLGGALSLGAIFLAGCAATLQKNSAGPRYDIPGDPDAPSQVTPSEALALAETYARHAWQPFARNIFHGIDSLGVRVDTPDASYHPADGRDGWWMPGEVNMGIPYKWGGFDDPVSFDAAIVQGRPAGDVSSPAKRVADRAAVSAQAAGVDCSGFVSRCLKLPTILDSAQLRTVCDAVPSAEALQPGDLLNIPHRHVMLFSAWARPDHSWIFYYETGGIPEWKPLLKELPLAAILALGFRPLHYRGMARETVPSGKEVLTRAMKEKAVRVAEPKIGEP